MKYSKLPHKTNLLVQNTPFSVQNIWKHFTFICSVNLACKVQAIAHKEGFTIRKLISLYRELEIDKQTDYDKFYLYSLITHSTAIEGSTITELENQIMFDQGISLKGKSITEQNMNLDLKNAYEAAIKLAHAHTDITIDLLIG